MSTAKKSTAKKSTAKVNKKKERKKITIFFACKFFIQ